MIPRIKHVDETHRHYRDFTQQLAQAGFVGDIEASYSHRIIAATDNSIYQVLPQAVLFPKTVSDIECLMTLVAHPRFQSIVISPRGGGTGTNGQSLTDGIVIDTSRYLNNIVEINIEERWAIVQPGVIKDQLNAALKPHGLFFSPELSTSNRATIGGMINTDASGQGSVVYGKTRDHVLSLESVFIGGERHISQPIPDNLLDQQGAANGVVRRAYQLLKQIDTEHSNKIRDIFPKLNRCLTGYDLAHIRRDNGHFDLNSLLVGSEGTLAVIVGAKINLCVIPERTALVCLQYDSFESSLRDAQTLMVCQPTSIETIDSKVLQLARGDNSWGTVSAYFPDPQGERITQGVNLVEFTADSADELSQKLDSFQAFLSDQSHRTGAPMSQATAHGNVAVKYIWAMRKKAVGLLGNVQGEARPIPFVEDTAVPPEHLADYIMAFRAILDRHQLAYGMFGHVDAGVLHVRPVLDMKQPEDERRIRLITDELVVLVKSFGGLLWGEHGKGFRSEFQPLFFGELFPVLQQVKAHFDPNNQINPGKIATPHDGLALIPIDAVPTRGQKDRTISNSNWVSNADALYCNGNGACFNYDPFDDMCPSYKATGDRRHSPKGRASLMREWLRIMSDMRVDVMQERDIDRFVWSPLRFIPRAWNSLRQQMGAYDFSHDVYDAMAGCLACKSCTGSCPVKVDVPEFRSRFMELYFGRYLRPIRHYGIGSLEGLLPWLARIRPLYNGVVASKIGMGLMARVAGLTAMPQLSGSTVQKARRRMHIPWATDKVLAALSESDRSRAVIIVQDGFTSYFDAEVVIDSIKLYQRLGFYPMLMPYQGNGKPYHVQGLITAFERSAKAMKARLEQLTRYEIPLVGVDPSMTLTFRSEYKKAFPTFEAAVLLPQEFLSQRLDAIAAHRLATPSAPYFVMGHCTERSNAPDSLRQWQAVFQALAVPIEEVKVGCCGMAGTYGHELQHQANSKRLFEISWAPALAAPERSGRVLSTGYSCRAQTQRMTQTALQHPLQALLKELS